MTQRQALALEALISAPSIEAAAQACGLSRSTLERYLQDDDFRAEYERRRGESLNVACAALQEAMTDAVAVLTAIMKEDATSATARISAARSVLEYGMKLTELTDLAARVAALEAAIRTEDAPQ